MKEATGGESKTGARGAREQDKKRKKKRKTTQANFVFVVRFQTEKSVADFFELPKKKKKKKHFIFYVSIKYRFDSSLFFFRFSFRLLKKLAPLKRFCQPGIGVKILEVLFLFKLEKNNPFFFFYNLLS